MLTTTHLDEKQYEDFLTLKKACYDFDKGVPAIYPHIMNAPRLIPTHGLYYHKKQLVAFIGIYFFYEDACEMTLMVHPKWRGKGLARELIQQMMPILLAYGMKELIFTSPDSFQESWKKDTRFVYDHSEYKMSLDLRRWKLPLHIETPLSIKKSSLDDIPILHHIDKSSFARCHPENEHRLTNMLSDDNYVIFLGYLDDKPIGKSHIHWQNREAVFSDIAVLPEHQHKGYGKTLILYCLQEAKKKNCKRAILDVETHNKRALTLYTSLGFSLYNSCDYWRCPVDQLLTP